MLLLLLLLPLLSLLLLRRSALFLPLLSRRECDLPSPSPDAPASLPLHIDGLMLRTRLRKLCIARGRVRRRGHRRDSKYALCHTSAPQQPLTLSQNLPRCDKAEQQGAPVV